MILLLLSIKVVYVFFTYFSKAFFAVANFVQKIPSFKQNQDWRRHSKIRWRDWSVVCTMIYKYYGNSATQMEEILGHLVYLVKNVISKNLEDTQHKSPSSLTPPHAPDKFLPPFTICSWWASPSHKLWSPVLAGHILMGTPGNLEGEGVQGFRRAGS